MNTPDFVNAPDFVNTADRVARPVIGLPGRRRKVGSLVGFPDNLAHLDVDLYFADYTRSVLAAGGIPVHLPVDADPRAYLEIVDGIVLSGGADVEPERYGQQNTASDTEPERDEFEFALLDGAVTTGVPVLGICRGLQILNVYTGGTLHQSVPEHARYDLATDDRCHPVAFVADSRLGTLYGSDLMVNSLHHQTVDRLGNGLTITGRADDGTVEALEMVGHDVVAVQWHPEMLDGIEPVWNWLIDRALARRA